MVWTWSHHWITAARLPGVFWMFCAEPVVQSGSQASVSGPIASVKSVLSDTECWRGVSSVVSFPVLGWYKSGMCS